MRHSSQASQPPHIPCAWPLGPQHKTHHDGGQHSVWSLVAVRRCWQHQAHTHTHNTPSHTRRIRRTRVWSATKAPHGGMTVTAQRPAFVGLSNTLLHTDSQYPSSKPDSLLWMGLRVATPNTQNSAARHTHACRQLRRVAPSTAPAPPLKKAPTRQHVTLNDPTNLQLEAAHALTGAQTHSTHAVLVCMAVESTVCSP